MQDARPSQPVYGNYHGYYTKRSNALNILDPRLKRLPNDIFKGKRALDVGCNEGWLTVDIAQHFGPCKVVGVDIDSDLIRGAWKRRRTAWSLQRCSTSDIGSFSPSASPSDFEDGGNNARRGMKRKRMESQTVGDVFSSLYPASQPTSSTFNADIAFPLSMEHMFGSLPIPPISMIQPSLQTVFPHNVSFYAADWTRATQSTVPKSPGHANGSKSEDGDIAGILKEDHLGYDVVIAFSITKWIHLNGGDEGLLAFFRKIHKVLRPGPTGQGGVLLLEPQDWEGYAKARKMSKGLAENYKTLRLRPSDFPQILTEMGFVEEAVYAQDGEGGFKRPILLFRKHG